MYSLCLIVCACGTSPAPATTPYDVTQEEFRARMNDSNVVILDVRTPAETAGGMIEGARELDFNAADFTERLDSLDRDATYLVYCRSGNRSGQACALMDRMGFREAHNLADGYLQWK
ncbi:Sulfurtransferase [Neolewinella maritima]|uniref:Sulfurtransferase n=1 Tax=Neolewinella maritima TaxID=1383882 RepID=A0ABN8F939_9BACT|nr:Sulfurtransferase [Neolewinella maritima]